MDNPILTPRGNDGFIAFDWAEFHGGTTPPPDADGDGVADSSDNCPSVANANQSDVDGDGAGDACDGQDNCPNEAGPASNNGCPVPPPSNDPFPGIRWFPVLGTYAGADQGWVSEPNLVDQQYADYVGSTRERNYLDLDNDNERYHFCGGRKFAWRDVLVDETLAPTSRAQAQNPDWSNYKWNQGDVVTEQLNASNRIAENKAKLCVFVATTATSTKNPVPTWMMQNNSFYGTNLTWRDGQGPRAARQAGRLPGDGRLPDGRHQEVRR
jgi:hypothetical protein